MEIKRMAKIEPGKPDDVKIELGNESVVDEKSASNQPLQDGGKVPSPELKNKKTDRPPKVAVEGLTAAKSRGRYGGRPSIWNKKAGTVTFT
jgi:hypothetical protein